ncbi:pyridoxamine 5'-phosphate oxidase family protein [Clostridium mediterraneense]|uniref:pyridoxamine 5'-phosphate oxidase family protein n=1 Tax=Clostridium mediterraneense TaxID=1805472 RepID=UPI000836D963|nr:pyridoxamine 5'-phosphate oxidase family protein [Clostridium mediterraneense]
MLTEKFYEVLKNEGVVSITSWGIDEPHVTNTWNSYLVVTDDERILIPAAGFNSTEVDVNVNNRVKVTLGSKEVEGFNNYQGTGFLIEGTANFIKSGKDFNLMKDKFPFLTRVLEITVTSLKQRI